MAQQPIFSDIAATSMAYQRLRAAKDARYQRWKAYCEELWNS
jgi:hypothetical protein